MTDIQVCASNLANRILIITLFIFISADLKLKFAALQYLKECQKDVLYSSEFANNLLPALIEYKLSIFVNLYLVY